MRRLLLTLGTLAIAFPAYAEDAADKTGTNPINFTNDFRVYNEYLWLNTPGDSTQNVTTMEYRTPFADGKWQFRTRIRGVSLNSDLNDDGVDEIDDGGFGDLDLRFLTVPYIDMSKRRAIAVGLEVSLPTASEESLGTERITLGPQVFAVKFAPFGIPNTMIVPAYQHKFSVYEQSDRDAINQGLIDLFILWSSKDKQYWGLLDSQAVIDYDENIEFGLIDAEAGMMLDKYLGTQGHSLYVRPSVGIGKHRATDGSMEIGYKIIW